MTIPVNELKALIAQYRICWRAYPEKDLVDGKVRAVGYRLELYGTHAPQIEHVSPGCDYCRNVWEALNKIGQEIVPAGTSDSQYQIEVFDDSIHYSKERRDRPDVELHIQIIHRSGFGPIDACEDRCLKEMTNKLRTLGSPEGNWKKAV